MRQAFNFLLLFAKEMLAVCLKYPAGGGKKGISAADIQRLQSGITDADGKNTEQEKAEEAEGKVTERLNETIAKGHGHIRKTQDAGMAEYGTEDKARKREFHIGGRPVDTAKQMGAELKYFKGVATDNLTDLMKHGYEEADLPVFDDISKELDKNSNDQINAQKVQKGATNERDSSMKELRKAIRTVQRSARVVFKDEPSILLEFESIHEGHGGKGKNPPPAPQGPQK